MEYFFIFINKAPELPGDTNKILIQTLNTDLLVTICPGGGQYTTQHPSPSINNQQWTYNLHKPYITHNDNISDIMTFSLQVFMEI